MRTINYILEFYYNSNYHCKAVETEKEAILWVPLLEKMGYYNITFRFLKD